MTIDATSATGEALAFVASAFALVRISLAHSRATTDRFVGYLERSLRRQEAINDRFERTIAHLAESVRENSALLSRVVERLGQGDSR